MSKGFVTVQAKTQAQLTFNPEPPPPHVTHPCLAVADFDDGLVLPQVPDHAAGGEGGRHDVLNLWENTWKRVMML